MQKKKKEINITKFQKVKKRKINGIRITEYHLKIQQIFILKSGNIL